MAETEIGCIAYAKQAFSIPSDLVEAGIGCIACARQAIDIPSDLFEAEIGCIVSARQAFFTPSNFVETDKRWKVCYNKPLRPPNHAQQAPNLHFSIPAIYKSIPHFETAML